MRLQGQGANGTDVVEIVLADDIVAENDSVQTARAARSSSKGCITKQVLDRPNCDPALEIVISLDEPESTIETSVYKVGTYPGADDVVKITTMGGNSEVVPILLPKFMEDGGRALFVYTESVNTEGNVASGSCSVANFDVTPPAVSVNVLTRLQSDTTSLTGSYKVTDDSSLVRLQYSVGRASKGDASVLGWRDIPFDPPADAGGSTGTAIENFKRTPDVHLYYFQGAAASTTKGLNLEQCARACLLYGSGMGCKGFDHDGVGNECILHSQLREGPGTKLIPMGNFHHYIRSDRTMSASYEGTLKIIDLALEHAMSYFINVRARNALGYSAIDSSPAVHVDLTPPEPGLIANASSDAMYADRCQAAKSQRCLLVTSKPNHRIIVDGLGSATVFNGFQPIYDDWYTRYNTFLVGNWDGFHDEESDLYQILFGVGDTVCSSKTFDWGKCNRPLVRSRSKCTRGS